MNVVLIGFRCTGKTTIGKLLAKKLEREFCDVDEFIEKRYNTVIKDIFQEKGETVFRMLESDCIVEIAKKDGIVIATGGGAVLRFKNMNNFKRNGVIFLLQAGSDTVFKRLKGREREKRPPLTNKSPYDEITEQLEYRREYYLKSADFIINTDNRKPEDIVGEMAGLLEKINFK